MIIFWFLTKALIMSFNGLGLSIDQFVAGGFLDRIEGARVLDGEGGIPGESILNGVASAAVGAASMIEVCADSFNDTGLPDAVCNAICSTICSTIDFFDMMTGVDCSSNPLIESGEASPVDEATPLLNVHLYNYGSC